MIPSELSYIHFIHLLHCSSGVKCLVNLRRKLHFLKFFLYSDFKISCCHSQQTLSQAGNKKNAADKNHPQKLHRTACSSEAYFCSFYLYAMSLPVNHRPQTILLHRALSQATLSIFFQLYLKPVASISFSRSLLHVFLFVY